MAVAGAADFWFLGATGPVRPAFIIRIAGFPSCFFQMGNGKPETGNAP